MSNFVLWVTSPLCIWTCANRVCSRCSFVASRGTNGAENMMLSWEFEPRPYWPIDYYAPSNKTIVEWTSALIFNSRLFQRTKPYSTFPSHESEIIRFSKLWKPLTLTDDPGNSIKSAHISFFLGYSRDFIRCCGSFMARRTVFVVV